MQRGPAPSFADFDTDGDGAISEAEFDAARQAMRPNRPANAPGNAPADAPATAPAAPQGN